MIKRIGILTLPLVVNYGGIIQAVALAHHLKSRGYEVVLLDKRRPLGILQRFVLTILEAMPFQNIGGVRQRARLRKLHDAFIRRFVPNRTSVLRSERQLVEAVESLNLDAVIVGSDQVWRMDYLPDQGYREFFLSFVQSGSTRRIAYAASFGTGDWTHHARTETVRELLSKFNAISVRERSGVALCRDVFGLDRVEHVLDPTLLVDPALYEIASAPPKPEARKTMLSYLLDAPARQLLVDATLSALPEHHYPATLRLKDYDAIDLSEWLRSFRDADFVLTDSFHGMVFSIIFRRPFIAIANVGRGMDRFTSLLSLLDISDRLIMAEDVVAVKKLISAPIDYDEVHRKLGILREQSASFLAKALA